MSDDDLYDDLDLAETKVAATAKVSKKSAPSNTLQPKSFSEELDALQQRVALFEKENETLRRNMGTLYRTAKSELGRKDAEIDRLREQLVQEGNKQK
jgi:CII-binding regulator of phage lambda lysogenization HflD